MTTNAWVARRDIRTNCWNLLREYAKRLHTKPSWFHWFVGEVLMSLLSSVKAGWRKRHSRFDFFEHSKFRETLSHVSSLRKVELFLRLMMAKRNPSWWNSIFVSVSYGLCCSVCKANGQRDVSDTIQNRLRRPRATFFCVTSLGVYNPRKSDSFVVQLVAGLGTKPFSELAKKSDPSTWM